MQRYWKLAALIIILQVLSWLTSYFVTQNAVAGWYKGIAKSPLNPPDWVFAPVWMVLYAVLGIALWRLWERRALPGARLPIALFLFQLGLNYTWSFIFFGMGAFAAAFAVIALIVGFTAACMLAARTVDRAVPWLLAPYLAWVSFAGYLTWSVMVLN